MFEKYVESWYEELNGRYPTHKDIGEFVTAHATCIEEFWAYEELLLDMFPEVEN